MHIDEYAYICLLLHIYLESKGAFQVLSLLCEVQHICALYLLSSKLEIQAKILNHSRYTDIAERYCMTQSDSQRHRTPEFDGKELTRFLASLM